MHDYNSALDACRIAGDYGVKDAKKLPLLLAERPLGCLLQIAGWGDFETQCRPIVSQFGFTNFGEYSAIQKSGNSECFAIAPDKIMVRHQNSNALRELYSAIDHTKLAVLDLSHARSVISISGEASEALMLRLAAIDFSLPAFPVGNFVQTGIHHVGVLIKRDRPNAFEIIIPFTWAASIWDYLCTCALYFGYRIEGEMK